MSDDRASSVSEIRIEHSELPVTDDELRRLSKYFEQGRDEIQKKVDYLLSQEIHTSRLGSVSSQDGKNYDGQANEAKDYIKVNLEIATRLREFAIGTCVHSLSNEWKQARFVFIVSDPNDELAFGLLTDKKGPRGLVLSVQAMFIKNLILTGYKNYGKNVSNSDWKNVRKVLKPTEPEKKDILAKTLAEILWKAGEMKSAFVAIDSGRNCFEPRNSGTKSEPKTNYFSDGLTEKLHIYEFESLKLLEDFIRKNLTMLQKENGCILFLYSLILSRGFERLDADLQGSSLLGDMEECKMPLYNLLLTGLATPYVHNGTVYYDSHGHSLSSPLVGIKSRNDIGLLYWNPKEKENHRTEVGSMLKTPRYPIWLSIMGRNAAVVLFSTNIDLVNDWRLEQNFSLHFFTGLRSQYTDFKLDLVCRHPNEIRDQRRYSKFGFDEEQEPEIISLIKTKWPDSELTNIDGKDLMQFL